MITKELMKIESVTFGLGGRENAEIGLHLTFSSQGTGIATSDSFWAHKWAHKYIWTEKERLEFLGPLVMRITEYLNQAKVKSVEELKGKPVEVTFEKNMLKSWRILTEVL